MAEAILNSVIKSMPIPPTRYLEEMSAFQAWNDFASHHHSEPVLVRAHVMTSLYVSFVWLRDSVLIPVTGNAQQDSVLCAVSNFLTSDKRRRLRNAIAHGRWCYLDDFSGLECWDGKPTLAKFEVTDLELKAWQALGRGTSIAILLAMKGRLR